MGSDCAGAKGIPAMTPFVRLARPEDAGEISGVIVAALRETNARDYPEAVIRRVAQNFSPLAVLGLMERRTMIVATRDARILGTASLDGNVVRTVFVAPDSQGQGIGRLLMAQIERAARETGIGILEVPSSVTAEPFYARLGFRPVRDSYHGEERTIIMERTLPVSP